MNKFIKIFLVFIFLIIFSNLLFAPVIKNMLNQKITIRLTGGRTVELLAKGSATITDSELRSPNLQYLIQKGDIVILQENKKNIKNKK